ncbi:TetR/AcrR family transcriptional regulator [Nakamurella aerolata]|uniref:TetR/AcrR family transcriptional regulator n=1 Tax=Nakamurella aerolata TaxID=1656892 RepID=A0A849A8D3_9ACTN|nr:TetR/AcrR family transcriptional regulator [Nakamurella aerolata]NNG36765.1 TetR/AcrR family transcriptional regulator [Nakamurella aerolata]
MPSPSPQRRGPYAKTPARRRQIIDAAMALFAAHGFHNTSLRDVAAAAGIGQSTLRHHFPDKEALLLAALRRRDELGAGDVPERAEDFPAHILGRATANRELPELVELYSVVSAESVTDGHPGRQYFIDRFAELRCDYTRFLSALAGCGRLRAGVDPETAATGLIALWDGLQVQWLLEPDRVDVPAQLAAYLDLIIIDGPGPGNPANS